MSLNNDNIREVRNYLSLLKICEKTNPFYAEKMRKLHPLIEGGLNDSLFLNEENLKKDEITYRDVRVNDDKNVAVNNMQDSKVIYLIGILTGKDVFKSILVNKSLIKIINKYRDYLISEIENDRDIVENEKELSIIVKDYFRELTLKDKLKYLSVAKKSDRTVLVSDILLLFSTVYDKSQEVLLNSWILSTIPDTVSRINYLSEKANLSYINKRRRFNNVKETVYIEQEKFASNIIEGYLEVKLKQRIDNKYDKYLREECVGNIGNFIKFNSNINLIEKMNSFSWNRTIFDRREIYEYLPITKEENGFKISFDENFVDFREIDIKDNRKQNEYKNIGVIVMHLMIILKEKISKKEIDGNIINKNILKRDLDYQKDLYSVEISNDFSEKEVITIRNLMKDILEMVYKKDYQKLDLNADIDKLLREIYLSRKINQTTNLEEKTIKIKKKL